MPCLALTATATERVRADIVAQLGLRGEKVLVAGFDRPNIFLEVRRRARAVDQVLELASEYPGGSGIVYCFSRARAEAFAADLSARGLPALPYHAGLPDERGDQPGQVHPRRGPRDLRDHRLRDGHRQARRPLPRPRRPPQEPRAILPGSGRAGRDGLPARALLLFSYGDAMKIRSLMSEREGAEAIAAEAALRGMLRYAESASCRRSALIAHFGQDYGREELRLLRHLRRAPGRARRRGRRERRHDSSLQAPLLRQAHGRAVRRGPRRRRPHGLEERARPRARPRRALDLGHRQGMGAGANGSTSPPSSSEKAISPRTRTTGCSA